MGREVPQGSAQLPWGVTHTFLGEIPPQHSCSRVGPGLGEEGRGRGGWIPRPVSGVGGPLRNEPLRWEPSKIILTAINGISTHTPSIKGSTWDISPPSRFYSEIKDKLVALRCGGGSFFFLSFKIFFFFSPFQMLFGVKLREVCSCPTAIKRERERVLDCFCSF